jgi:hypothetical protein
MHKLKPEYIVGLTDGEGSFTVYIRNPYSNKDRKRRVVAEPKFYIKFIEKDKKILYELKKYFGCGKIYFQKDSRPNHKNCYRYEVIRRKDLEKIIIPFFQKYKLKLPSKKKDFNLFCKIFKRIQKGDHLNKNKLKILYKIKQNMH